MTDHLPINYQYRENAENGIWISGLLPLCLCIQYLTQETSEVYEIVTFLSIILFIDFVISRCFASQRTPRCLSMISLLPFCILVLLKPEKNLWILVISYFIFIQYLKVLRRTLDFILQNCPKSFTLGEAFVVSLGLILFSSGSFFSIVFAWSQTPLQEMEIIQIIIQVGLLTVLFIILTVIQLYKLNNETLSFVRFVCLVTFYVFIMLGFLHIILDRSPLLFIINFVFGDYKRISMIFYWLVMILCSVWFVNFQISSQEKATTAKRKVFHLLAVAVYFPGLIYSYELLYLASGVALAVIIMLEMIRKMNYGEFSKILNDGFSVFADEKDAGNLSTTVLYLSTGLNSGMALNSIANKSGFAINSICGVLSVGIGDTAASYFGSKFGKIKITGTNKSLEGTIANFVVQMLTIQFLVWLGYTHWHFMIVITILINCLAEALSDQVDNLILPLITYAGLTFAV